MKPHPLDGYSMQNADEFIILDELLFVPVKNVRGKGESRKTC
jgi:hypothetical protein